MNDTYIWCKNVHVEAILAYVGTAHIWDGFPDIPQILGTSGFVSFCIPDSLPKGPIWFLI